MSYDGAELGLPAVLQPIDISDLAELDPRQVMVHRARLSTAGSAAGRALAYARIGGRSYGEIGFRFFAASPRRGPTPLQTSALSAMQRSVTEHQKRDPAIDEILRQQPKLRHRAMAMPLVEGGFRTTIDRQSIHLYHPKQDAHGRRVEERWTFALTDLPESLLAGTVDRDEPPLTSRVFQVDLAATHWLPLSTLLAQGRFRKLQDIRPALERQTSPDGFYCFLSHRWLSPDHPDPDALQARFAAWQMIAYLVEAIRVAGRRGLHQPRRFSPMLGQPVGPRGTGLAESLIVNLLRSALDEDSLRQAVVEAQTLEADLADYGVERARHDEGLERLNGLLAERPLLRALSERIFLWYDYSCLPQPPREPADQELFVRGLQELSAAQVIGRTSIMLDDADDYLSRAWCTLEALVADTLGDATDLLVGSARPSAAGGEVEHYFDALLQDHPHVIWRAVLDTEIFGVQSPETCMQRLGLDATDPADLPFIYQRLSSLSAPTKVHVDDSEIVTGVLPLPAFENGTIVLHARDTTRSTAPVSAGQPASLDWTAALTLSSAWGPDEPIVPALQRFETANGGPRAMWP